MDSSVYAWIKKNCGNIRLNSKALEPNQKYMNNLNNTLDRFLSVKKKGSEESPLFDETFTRLDFRLLVDEIFG